MSRKKSAKERRLTGIEVPAKKGVSGSGKIFTPPNLTKTQAAIWERLIDSIDTKALLEIDSYTLGRYCYWVDVWYRHAELADGQEVELFINGQQELRRINPSFAIVEKAEKWCQQFEKDFGFNLRSRLQMSEVFAEVEEESDIMDQFLL